jgi:hypothetical protein
MCAAIVERDALRAELETERMRVTACGVVAMANTPETAARAREMHQDYWCASVADVARMVDSEMALRARVKALEDALRECCRSYDHDEDAHSLGTPCAKCGAEAVLENKP